MTHSNRKVTKADILAEALSAKTNVPFSLLRDIIIGAVQTGNALGFLSDAFLEPLPPEEEASFRRYLIDHPEKVEIGEKVLVEYLDSCSTPSSPDIVAIEIGGATPSHTEENLAKAKSTAGEAMKNHGLDPAQCAIAGARVSREIPRPIALKLLHTVFNRIGRAPGKGDTGGWAFDVEGGSISDSNISSFQERVIILLCRGQFVVDTERGWRKSGCGEEIDLMFSSMKKGEEEREV
jgi:hypothetical protein